MEERNFAIGIDRTIVLSVKTSRKCPGGGAKGEVLAYGFLRKIVV